MANSSLSDNAEIVMGQSPPGEKCNKDGQGLPLLNGPTEYGPHHPMPVQFTTDSRKRARQGDILFCVRGSTTGRMNWADRDYAIGRGVAAIRHKSIPALQPFVRAVIEYGLPELLAQATGSTFPNVSAGQLACLWWPQLEEVEQRAISKILGTLDDKIELNRHMNETLEAIARAIFKSWFVDFDPVRAKADGRLPVGMDAETAALFPNSSEDSMLGKVPLGWKLREIGDVVRVVGGSTPSTKNSSYWGGSIGFATPRDMAGLESPILLETARKITDEGLQKIGSGLLPIGTILLSSRAPVGYLAIAETPVAINQGIIAMNCGEDISKYFILNWTRENLPTVISLANGTTFAEISKNSFRHIELCLPPELAIRKFAEIVGPLYERIKSNVLESSTLGQVHDSLLPKLISGEIRVEDAEKFVEEHAGQVC